MGGCELHTAIPRLARASEVRLAPREEQVLRLVAEGWSATAIAARLKISPKTAETHRKRAYEKLRLNRRTLVRYAVKAGWLSLFLLAAPLHAQRTYWPVSVDSLATGKVLRTHVAVRGVVGYVGHEGDQDMHVRLLALSGSGKYIVAECIPSLPCRATSGLPWVPALGDTVTIYGISRRDPEHGNWAEIHPVEAISP